jgi:3-(3-hydroxy-phenyl)propionate hydroxylase
MGAGVRDAANLSWKLAGVVQGRLPRSVLDTYEIERKPHVRSLIRTAKLVGTAMTAGGRLGDVLRRIIAPHLHHVPGLQRHILDSQTPRLRRSALVVRPRLRPTSAGRLCPNPLIDHRHFDDVVAGRLALVTTMRPTTRQRAHIERFGAVVVEAPVGTALHTWLEHDRARAAIVRPDGAVLRAGRDLAALCAALPRIETPSRIAGSGR